MPGIGSSQNITWVQFKESSAPATPGSGYGRLYVNSSGVLHYIDDAGLDIALAGFDGTITGAFALSGDISPTALAADTNDWNPTGLSGAAVIRASTSANYALTGLQGGSDGRVIVLHNVGSYDLQLKHEDSGSTAAYRFTLPASRNLRLLPGCAAVLLYDATSSRWRVSATTGYFAGETIQEIDPVTKTDGFTSSSSSFTDVTGLSASITPKSSASKIEVEISVSVGVDGGGLDTQLQIVRGSTAILIGDTAGSKTRTSATMFGHAGVVSMALAGSDAPATTSSTTYKLQGLAANSGAGFAVNRSYIELDLASYFRAVSTIKLREVCQ